MVGDKRLQLNIIINGIEPEVTEGNILIVFFINMFSFTISKGYILHTY